MPHVFKIGALYSPDRRRWPEGIEYNYARGEHELRLFLEHPRVDEIAAVASGEVHLGLHVALPLIAILSRFGPEGEWLPWSLSPYSIHLVPPDLRTMPPGGGERTVIRIVLVDAASGILRALRLALLAPAFSDALHDAIRAQADAAFDRRKYDAAVNALEAPPLQQVVRHAQHLTWIAAKIDERREA